MWSKHDVCECGNGAVSTLDLCGCAVPVITTEKSTWKMWQPGQGSAGRWELPTHLIVPGKGKPQEMLGQNLGCQPASVTPGQERRQWLVPQTTHTLP